MEPYFSGEDGVHKKRKWWLTSFRLNLASWGAGETLGDDDTPEFTILVGGLGPDVTDCILLETFKSHYTSIKGAKVVIDRITGHAKGFGFVRFGDESEQLRAMTEMNGVYCSSQPMRIGVAANEIATSSQQQYLKVPEGLEMAMTEDIISESYRMEIEEIDDDSDREKGKQEEIDVVDSRNVPAASSDGRLSFTTRSFTTRSKKIRRSLKNLFLTSVIVGIIIIGSIQFIED